MAIFARADLQPIIEENAAVFGNEALRVSLAQLNTRNPIHSLAAEWEIVVMHALNCCGAVQPILDSPRGSHAALNPKQSVSSPDLLFRRHAASTDAMAA